MLIIDNQRVQNKGKFSAKVIPLKDIPSEFKPGAAVLFIGSKIKCVSKKVTLFKGFKDQNAPRYFISINFLKIYKFISRIQEHAKLGHNGATSSTWSQNSETGPPLGPLHPLGAKISRRFCPGEISSTTRNFGGKIPATSGEHFRGG